MTDRRELQKSEYKSKARFSRLSLMFILITILFAVWIVFVALGIIIYELKPTWALLSLDSWIYAGCVLVAFFIFLELVFYFNHKMIGRKKLVAEKPKPEYYGGRRVHIYTYPKNSDGGIFSKTYVTIDGKNVLRLRTLMIPPGELWTKKEQNKT